jgi:hypothetical protein
LGVGPGLALMEVAMTTAMTTACFIQNGHDKIPHDGKVIQALAQKVVVPSFPVFVFMKVLSMAVMMVTEMAPKTASRMACCLI